MWRVRGRQEERGDIRVLAGEIPKRAGTRECVRIGRVSGDGGDFVDHADVSEKAAEFCALSVCVALESVNQSCILPI